MRNTSNEYLHIGNDVFSKELLLVSLENLHHLHRTSIVQGTTPSEIVNKLIKEAKENADNAQTE